MKKITITGSLGNVGGQLAQILIAQGHQLTIVTSKEERVEAIEALGAKAVVSEINDVEQLTNAFQHADAVFAMTPPNLGGERVIENTIHAGKSIATAIQNAQVKRVVLLSSIGADYPSGTGPIVGLHHIEQVYNELPEIHTTFLRAGYFYTNFYNDVPMIQHANILGANYPSDVNLPLVHPKDIAAAAAEELTADKTGKDVRYIVSAVAQPKTYTQLIGTAIGKPELPWVELTDEQVSEGMKQAGLPEEIAGMYTEMGQGIREGKLMSHFEQTGSPVTGTTKLELFVNEFAEKIR